MSLLLSATTANISAILTDQGRIAIATAIKTIPNQFMGWGRGDGAWTLPPPPNPTATQLIREVGRRRVTQLDYAIPSPTGEILVPNGQFAVSLTPTRWLYYRFAFEMPDASAEVIREQGIFLNTVLAAGVPVDTWYLTPEQVANRGSLLVLQNIAPLVREPSIRQFFEFIISF